MNVERELRVENNTLLDIGGMKVANGVLNLSNHNIQKIGKLVCSARQDIKRVIFPEELIEIEENAFAICPLTELSLPVNLKIIGEDAFTDGLFTETTFPDGLKKIDGLAFANCKLTEITLSDNIEEIGYNAFFDCPITKINIRCRNEEEFERVKKLFPEDLQAKIEAVPYSRQKSARSAMPLLSSSPTFFSKDTEETQPGTNIDSPILKFR